MATGCFLNPALRHQKGATSWCSARQNWSTERAIAMVKLAQEDHSYCPSSQECERYRKIGIFHWTNEADMHWWNSDKTPEQQAQLRTISTENVEKNGLNQFLFINITGSIRLLPHGGSGMKIGGAHNLSICCSKIDYSWWQSVATDGECEQNTLTRHNFLVFVRTRDNVSHDIGPRC